MLRDQDALRAEERPPKGPFLNIRSDRDLHRRRAFRPIGGPCHNLRRTLRRRIEIHVAINQLVQRSRLIEASPHRAIRRPIRHLPGQHLTPLQITETRHVCRPRPVTHGADRNGSHARLVVAKPELVQRIHIGILRSELGNRVRARRHRNHVRTNQQHSHDIADIQTLHR